MSYDATNPNILMLQNPNIGAVIVHLPLLQHGDLTF